MAGYAVDKKIREQWEDEAKKFGRYGEVYKIFSDYYSPTLIATFYAATEKTVYEIVGTKADIVTVLGLFTEVWRLAVEKSRFPSGMFDFQSLLSEAVIIWEENGRKDATIETLHSVWR